MTQSTHYSVTTRLVHFGLALFGIAAYLTAEMAEESGDFGYLVHAYLGLATMALVVLRALSGFSGPAEGLFAHWSMFGAMQRRLIKEDLVGLLKLRLPHRDLHEGIAGMVQAFGLLLFAWMALTGTGMFVLGEGDGFAHTVEEAHEIGEGLIPVFLVLHVGAVITHLLTGSNVLPKMFGRNG